MPGRSSPITLRAQALAMLEEGVPVSRIIEYTTLSKATIFCIKFHIDKVTELEGRNNYREGRDGRLTEV
jgi:hypothetical protein